jgi:hypothetical protein
LEVKSKNKRLRIKLKNHHLPDLLTDEEDPIWRVKALTQQTFFTFDFSISKRRKLLRFAQGIGNL